MKKRKGNRARRFPNPTQPIRVNLPVPESLEWVQAHHYTRLVEGQPPRPDKLSCIYRSHDLWSSDGDPACLIQVPSLGDEADAWYGFETYESFLSTNCLAYPSQSMRVTVEMMLNAESAELKEACRARFARRSTNGDFSEKDARPAREAAAWLLLRPSLGAESVEASFQDWADAFAHVAASSPAGKDCPDAFPTNFACVVRPSLAVDEDASVVLRKYIASNFEALSEVTVGLLVVVASQTAEGAPRAMLHDLGKELLSRKGDADAVVSCHHICRSVLSDTMRKLDACETTQNAIWLLREDDVPPNALYEHARRLSAAYARIVDQRSASLAGVGAGLVMSDEWIRMTSWNKMENSVLQYAHTNLHPSVDSDSETEGKDLTALKKQYLTTTAPSFSLPAHVVCPASAIVAVKAEMNALSSKHWCLVDESTSSLRGLKAKLLAIESGYVDMSCFVSRFGSLATTLGRLPEYCVVATTRLSLIEFDRELTRKYCLQPCAPAALVPRFGSPDACEAFFKRALNRATFPDRVGVVPEVDCSAFAPPTNKKRSVGQVVRSFTRSVRSASGTSHPERDKGPGCSATPFASAPTDGREDLLPFLRHLVRRYGHRAEIGECVSRTLDELRRGASCSTARRSVDPPVDPNATATLSDLVQTFCTAPAPPLQNLQKKESVANRFRPRCAETQLLRVLGALGVSANAKQVVDSWSSCYLCDEAQVRRLLGLRYIVAMPSAVHRILESAKALNPSTNESNDPAEHLTSQTQLVETLVEALAAASDSDTFFVVHQLSLPSEPGRSACDSQRCSFLRPRWHGVYRVRCRREDSDFCVDSLSAHELVTTPFDKARVHLVHTTKAWTSRRDSE